MENFTYNSSPYNLERSLLQKAVRRGNINVLEKVYSYLLSTGNKEWLKNRLFVMTYEECWPFATQINLNNILGSYKKLALTVKNKNAAGLSTLALALNDGSFGLHESVPEEKKIAFKSVANAIKDPERFWEWIKKQPDYKANKEPIQAAELAINYAGFSYDQAMMIAAAYLALTEPVPEIQYTQPNNNPDFPFWVAFDKHTQLGKEVLNETSNQLGINTGKAKKITFYLEGAVCNQLAESPYWDMVIKWQGMDRQYAADTWEKMRPILIEKTKYDVKELKARLENVDKKDEQLTLF